ncbi:MAG: TonB-dependent receptor, partial [Deltaproteobacteria bacterium]|nr:TonB-dependent receptor [Deltaproteobacteria bacterium]
FNEFNALFQRNRLGLQASGIVGENATYGDDIVFSGLQGRYSFSLGLFNYKTDGFRDNNDFKHNVANIFSQVRLSPKTSIQGEYRYSDNERGDLELTSTGSFIPTLRQGEDVKSIRLGLHHAFTPKNDLIASVMYQYGGLNLEMTQGPMALDLSSNCDHYIGEIEFLHKSSWLHLTGGFSHRHLDGELNEIMVITPPVPFLPPTTTTRFEKSEVKFTSAYLYSQFNFFNNFSFHLGLSADSLDETDDTQDVSLINPKLGITYQPVPSTTIRAAVFKTLQRPFFSRLNIDPSIEPTQVAGFNQFFFGARGDHGWRYGLALDHKFPKYVYTGVEVSKRDLVARFIDRSGPTPSLVERNWDEYIGRAYFYLTPHPWVALTAEYLYEYFKRDVSGGFAGTSEFETLKTHRLPLGIKFFHPCGVSAGLTATSIDQKGGFVVFSGPTFSIVQGQDSFWMVDASIGYRLPKRHGLITFEVKNLFDEQFSFQDTDPGNPRILPGRVVLLRATFSF